MGFVIGGLGGQEKTKKTNKSTPIRNGNSFVIGGGDNSSPPPQILPAPKLVQKVQVQPTLTRPQLNQPQPEPSAWDEAMAFLSRFMGAASEENGGNLLVKSLNDPSNPVSSPDFRKRSAERQQKLAQDFSKLSPTTQNVASYGGSAAGTMIPLGASSKIASGLVKGVAPRLAPLASDIATQVVTGGLYEGGKGIQEGKSPAEVAKKAGEGMLLFGAAGPLGSVVGKKVASLLPEAAGHYAGNLAKGATTGLGFSYGGNLLEGQPLDNAGAAKNAAAFAALDLLLGGKAKMNTNTLEPQLKPSIGANREPNIQPITPKVEEMPISPMPKIKPTPSTPEEISKEFNQKDWYHGTGNDNLTTKNLDPFYGNHEGLFGHGIYLTDSPEIAQGYANARSKRTKTPSVYKVNIKTDRILDVEKPITPDVAKTIESSAYDAFREDVRRSISKPGSTPETVIQDLRKAVSEYSAEEMIPTSEFVEMFQDLVTNLKNTGYDAITHTGGLRTGKSPHKVTIMLDPNDYYSGTGRTGQISNMERYEPQPLGKTSTFPLEPQALKERKFAQNVKDSSVATADIKQNLKNNALTYDPITNKDTFDKATHLVKDDINTAVEQFNTPNKKLSADDVAVGEALIVKSIKEGNSSEANRLIADLAEKLTTAGQAIQAASVFKKFTPEGMLLYAQRMVNRANRESIEKMGTKAKKIVLTSEDSDFIIQNMEEAQALPDGRKKDIAIAKVMQLIADKIPATIGERVRGVQRIALLLNPRTMTRNVVGNTLFSAVDNLSNVVATPIDKAMGRLTGQRTTTLPSLTGQLRSGLQGAKETIEDARLGIDTSPSRSQYDLPDKRIFETKTLNALDKATRVGLQLGDRPFYKAAYDDSLRQQVKLAKVSEATPGMIENAHKIAQQRTYQDTNALTEAFKIAQRALNKASGFVGLGNEEFGLGNLVIPFVKTPANILARAIEYTPIGVAKALKEATNIGKGKFNQKTFVDAISRSVTGTALIMVGYDLAKRGVITGSGNEDKDVAAFERGLGKNDFSYKVGDKYYTYDWAQPASMALAIGADMYLKGKNRKDAENVVFDAVKSGGETLFKQSLMQGIQRFMGGFSPIDNLETTALNAPTMFMPTLLRQVNQLTDDTQRNTYSPTKIGTAWNIVKSKVPGLSQTLEPKIDTFGNTAKTLQGKNNLFNVLINPGTTTEFKPTKAQKELIGLYDTTGDKDIFPKLAPRYFTVKGQRYNLTPQEITKFQQTMGKKTEIKLNHIADSSYSDEAKIKQIKKAIEKAYEDAKKEAVRNRKK